MLLNYLKNAKYWGIALVIGSAFLGRAGAQAAPPAIDLPGDRVFPESITSTADGTLYVGSLADGGIFRISPGTAEAELWIKPGAYGTRSIFGVLADERSKTLWACSNDATPIGVAGPSSVPGSTLKGFDLATGQEKISAQLPGAYMLCNDIAIGQDGSAYVTNSMAPQILKLRPGAKDLEVWLVDPQLAPTPGGAGLDGIAFGNDGNLYVNMFGQGTFFRIEVTDGVAGKVTQLQTSRILMFPDGLRPTEGLSFLMVEGSGKLDRLTIDGNTVSVETLQDGLHTPTGVTPVRNTAWISEGQLEYIFDPRKKGQTPSLPFKVQAIPLDSR